MIYWLFRKPKRKVEGKTAKEWNELGLKVKNPIEKLECYSRAIELNPKYDWAWYNKGWTLDELGRNEDALECYDKALELNPKLEEAWYSKGEVLGKLGRYGEALECYDKALELNPDGEDTWFGAGEINSKLGRYDEALVCYDQVIELNPDNPEALHNKEEVLRKLTNNEERSEKYDKTVQLSTKMQKGEDLLDERQTLFGAKTVIYFIFISFAVGIILVANGLILLYEANEHSSDNASKTSTVPVATLTPTQLTPSSIPAITQTITPATTKEHPSNWLVTHKKDVLIGKVCSDCHQSKFCTDCHDTTAKSSKAPYKEEHVWDGSKPDKFSLTYTWNPISSDAFYYDKNVSNESLTISLDSYSDRNIQEGTLKYFTSPNTISFKYSQWGSYNVIGFLADKYFTGYTAGSTGITSTPISAISSKQLHKVLIDDDTRRAVYAGSTLTLKEGYVLKVESVDTASNGIALSLLKDGNVVDFAGVGAGKTYVYRKNPYLIPNLPVIAVHIDKVFAGREANAAFVNGIFQISESYTSVNLGDRYGIMEITELSDAGITMVNKGSFILSPGSIVDVMGDIKFKVEDSSVVRFYPFVEVKKAEMPANQLVIDASSTPMAGDTIIITVTAGGNTITDASVSLDNTQIGTTDSTGKMYYTPTISGMHNITATKLGYSKAVKTIQVAEFVENRLSIEVPAVIDQGFPISIKVIANRSAIEGAAVTLDNAAIGTTDARGILNYTFNVGGMHNLSASKAGYISVVREINIRMPFSD